MPSRPTWFWTSLGSSVVVNAVLLTSSACWFYSQMKIYLPGYARADVFVPIFVEDANPSPIPDTTLGDADGKGDAADAMSGDEPMQAAQGPQSQALLSRDPEGPGKIGQEPSMSTAIPGENGNGDNRAAAMFGANAPPSPAQAPTFAPKVVVQATSSAGEKHSVAKDQPYPSPSTAQDDKSLERPNSLAKAEQPAQAAPPQVAYASAAEALPGPPVPPAPQASTAAGGKPGSAVAAADPAPMSDSESDPFSKKGAVAFKRGSTDVQFGRKHKIVRPRLGLAAQTDLLNLRDPVTLVLALTLDESGKVIRVDVLKSSGSRNLDQACKVAAYQWWLEPTRDKATGKPIKDVVPFVIGFS